MLCVHPSDTDGYLGELKEHPCKHEVVRCLECGWIAASQPHPKVHRQDLAGQMHATLPREIRDIIYSYCWGPNDLSAFPNRRGKYGHKACPATTMTRGPKWRPILEVHPGASKPPPLSDWACRCMTLSNTPYYVIPRYVGIDAAREAAAAYYTLQPRPREFEAIQIQDLQGLLTRDVFHVGIIPAEYLKDLRLHIRVPKEILMEEPVWPNKVRLLKVPLNMPAARNVLADSINALSSIRLKHELHVCLEIHLQLKVEDVMFVLTHFEPVYHELKRGGAKIDMWLGFLFGSVENVAIPGPTDSWGLNGVYERQRKDWLKGKRRNLY